MTRPPKKSVSAIYLQRVGRGKVEPELDDIGQGA
jgi:hypothetical protein